MLNTMPMRARSFRQVVTGSLTDAGDDRAFLEWLETVAHLISVDLPEPDGPQTTTTSPWHLGRAVLQHLKGLYHLLTLLSGSRSS